ALRNARPRMRELPPTFEWSADASVLAKVQGGPEPQASGGGASGARSRDPVIARDSPANNGRATDPVTDREGTPCARRATLRSHEADGVEDVTEPIVATPVVVS